MERAALRDHLMSLRGRIITWYLGLLAALLLGLCVVQTVTLTSYLRAARVESMRQAATEGLALTGPCFIRTPADLRRKAQGTAELLGSSDVSTAVVTRSGRVLARYRSGPASGALTVPPAIVHTLLAAGAAGGSSAAGSGSCRRGAPDDGAVSSTRSGNTLYVAIPLGPAGHPIGFVVLARSMAAENATLQHVRLTLILGALAVLIVAGIMALPIMNRALRPLHRVTATAERIAAGDLEQRANLTASIDEVGRLGKAFDRMVDRLQGALSTSMESEAQMRRFLADASHELRTPLTVLRGASRLLLRHHELDAEETASTIDAIHHEAERMSRLLDDLLTLSKLDAGVPLDPHPVVVSRFLDDFLSRYAPVWPARPIAVRLGDLNGTRTLVDPEALRRILTNLIDNAARYSAPGRPITIAGRVDAEEVSIRVEDEGPGLRAEDAGRVFERFYRGNKSRARASGGSGLGLSIVYALVQQSAGGICIDTGPDRGTTVTITLPLLPEPGHPATDADHADHCRERAQPAAGRHGGAVPA